MGLLTPRYPAGAEPAREPTRRDRRIAAINEAADADHARLQRQMEDMAGITTEEQRREWRKTFRTATD